jgi:hypothetical protein
MPPCVHGGIMIEFAAIFLLIQLALYGSVLVALIFGFRFLGSGNRALGLLLLILAAVPFAVYALEYVHEREQPSARDAEVASWPRTRLSPDSLPAVIVTYANWHIAKSLVEGGPFRKAYAKWDRNDWIVYERRPNPDCPVPSNLLRTWYNNDRLSETPCVTATRTTEPKLKEPHLRLLHDQYAPSRNKIGEASNTVVAGATLELRLWTNSHDVLVAFWEIPYFKAPSFPPLVTRGGWAREDYAPRRYEPRADPRKFVIDAISGPT